jgi:hypothetical protein
MPTPTTRQRPRLRITSMEISGRRLCGFSERSRGGGGSGGGAGIATFGTGPLSDFPTVSGGLAFRADPAFRANLAFFGSTRNHRCGGSLRDRQGLGRFLGFSGCRNLRRRRSCPIGGGFLGLGRVPGRQTVQRLGHFRVCRRSSRFRTRRARRHVGRRLALRGRLAWSDFGNFRLDSLEYLCIRLDRLDHEVELAEPALPDADHGDESMVHAQQRLRVRTLLRIEGAEHEFGREQVRVLVDQEVRHCSSSNRLRRREALSRLAGISSFAASWSRLKAP